MNTDEHGFKGNLLSLQSLFASLFGAFLGLALLKFGNPPLMEKYVAAPANIWELLFNSPWPIGWAYVFLGLLTVLGLFLARWKPGAPDSNRAWLPRERPTSPDWNRALRRWLLVLPLLWLGWQWLAAGHTLDPQLTQPTVAHFVACVVCFYLGFFSLSRCQSLVAFWLPLLGGFLWVLAVGWEQHFGGLEETRRYFFLYIYPTLPHIQPEYLKKMSSNRIFSTQFYPNALAGLLLVLLPVALAFVGQARRRLTLGARGFVALVIVLAALGCLFWSGSKGGWLLMLLLGLLALLRLSFSATLKWALVVCVLLVGLTGFFYKYSGFFKKGATSVVARFDYWQAALQTTRSNPLFGTGPGTFAIPYQQIKRPESEMARLVHNDYLEQASDSGLPAFLFYSAFVVSALLLSYPRSARFQSGESGYCTGKAARLESGTPAALAEPWLRFALWLGVLGWALQSLFEFGLYLPALAWPAFTFLGLLLGTHTRGGDSLSPRTRV